MATTKTLTKEQKLNARLLRLATKAADARYAFEKAFDKAQANQPLFNSMCDKMGISRRCNSGDWMC